MVSRAHLNRSILGMLRLSLNFRKLLGIHSAILPPAATIATLANELFRPDRNFVHYLDLYVKFSVHL